MGFEVESLESNVQDDEDNEATKEQLAVAKAVKQKIERLME
jgi:hypothetical protein